MRATTISKEVAEEHADEDVYIEYATSNITEVIIEPEEDDDVYYISNEVYVTLTTEDGYFVFDNKQIKIKKRSSTEVIFMLPFGVSEVTVETKEGGEVVSRQYVAK